MACSIKEVLMERDELTEAEAEAEAEARIGETSEEFYDIRENFYDIRE